MPVTWSPDLLLPGQKIPRAVVSIPRDQQLLHDRSDSWTRRGVPNVPPSVLEGVKNFHTRNQTTVPLQSGHLSQSQSTRRDEQAAHPPSDDGTAISWASSPVRVRDRVAPAPLPDPFPASSPASRPAPVVAPRGVSIIETSIPSQALTKNPATVKPALKPHYRVGQILAEPPLSSLASSDSGLEVEPPRAIPAPLEPVNRAAVAIALEPTPPSAQIIPCTYTEHPSPPKPPPAKRRRYMRDPKAIFGTPTPEPVARPRNSVSASPTTGSYLPRQSARPVSSNSSGHAPPAHSAADDVGPILTVAQGLQTIHGIQEATNEQHSSSSEKIPPNGPASQVPYTAFKLAYPDFEADLHDFIRAVLSLKIYRKNMLLPCFLYDDFIRVFCNDYLKYTSDMDTMGENNLSAVKWYNSNINAPRYLKNIVTSNNLDDVLDQYPEAVNYLETQVVKKGGHGKSTQNKESTATPVEAEVPDPVPPTSLSKSPSATGAEREAISRHSGLVSDPMDIAVPPEEPPVETDRVISAAVSIHPDRSSTSRSGAFRTRPTEVEQPVAPAQEKQLNFISRPEPRQPSGSLPPKRLPGSLQEKSAADPMQAQRIPQNAESPVLAYARRHSLQTDPLPTTSVPLSQQSDADSIADPPRPKKKKSRWRLFLETQPPSSSMAGPSASSER